MKVPTTISFILGNNVIYQTSCDEELLEDESSKDDIYEEFEDKDKKSLKISKIRYFNKGKFLIKIKQYKYELIFNCYFNEPVVLPKSLTHLTFGSRINKPINLPKSLTHLTLGWNFNYCHQKDLKVKYNDEIIEIQNLPIKISYYY